MYRTKCINYYNAFCKQFDRNEHFLLLTLIRLELWSASESMHSARLNNLLVRDSVHEKFAVWNGHIRWWWWWKWNNKKNGQVLKNVDSESRKKKSTTTAKIGKIKEKEQIAISPSHRSLSRHGHASASYWYTPIPHPTPPRHPSPTPLPDTSNLKTEFLGNRLALRYENWIQLPWNWVILIEEEDNTFPAVLFYFLYRELDD